MTVLVVGLSHSSAPVAVLERAVLGAEAQAKLLRDMQLSDHVAGSLVLSTCNRVEVYAEVDRFHGGLTAICELLARHSGLSLAELTSAAYVHYDDRAVAHLLSVTCGLESMVVGESQILGQVRAATRLAARHDALGPELSGVARLALRTGKRAHAETGIDAAGASLVTLGLDLAAERLGRSPGAGDQLAGLGFLVVGAGSMSALAVATASRRGANRIVVANRTRAHADRLAGRYQATATGLGELSAAIAAADVVITCTGAPGYVITDEMLAARDGRRLVLLDLALPRDVQPSVGRAAGISLIDLETLGAAAENGFAAESEVAAVRRIVAAELGEFGRAGRAASVAPTVVALRAKAASVVDAELTRLEQRLGDMDERAKREIAQAMGRIADKLLHAPTVRVKELASAPGGDAYAAALRMLFGLDPEAVDSVATPAGELFGPARETEQ
jgi:glutamyl-tRNA reductase